MTRNSLRFPASSATAFRVVIALLAGALFALSACSTADPCGPFQSMARTTGFDDGVFKVDPAVQAGFDLRPVPVEGDTLGAGELALQIRLDGELYASRSPATEAPAPFRIPLVPTAHACSPPIPQYAATVQDIRITSTAALGNAYPPGTNLASLFDIIGRSGPIGEPLARRPLTEFLAQASRPTQELFLVLTAVPEEPTKMQFTVTYMQDGEGREVHTFTAPAVVVGGAASG